MAEWVRGIAKIPLPTPFPVGDVNVYVIKGDRLTLVDAGPKTEEALMKLKAELKSLRLELSDIEQVILTHHHPDHSGMLDLLPEHIEIYGHENNNRWIYQTNTFFDEVKAFFKDILKEIGLSDKYVSLAHALKIEEEYLPHKPLTGALEENDTPPGLYGWTVFETFGHAQSHIGLYREKDGVYIGGDHLLARISPNPLLEPPLPGQKERPKPQLQYNESLRKLLNIPMAVVYAGHGEEIYHKNELIKIRLKEQHQRALQVKQWLEKNSLTIFEVCQRLFPTVYRKQPIFTISETVAQFDYLQSLKAIQPITDKGVIRYFAS